MPSTFFIVKLVESATQPGTLLLACSVLGALLLAWRRMRRWGLLGLLLGLSGLTVCAVTPVGSWLLGPLENRFPQPVSMPANVTGIILLGGAIDLKVSEDRNVTALNMRGERMLAFVRLARTYPHATLLFTGGNGSAFHTRGSEAAVARRLFHGLGLVPPRLMFENHSRNTHENAVFSYRLVHPAVGQRWLLVTSAADMPRAVGCFRAAGWPVVPYPVDYHTRRYGAAWFPGLAKGLMQTDWAIHEWLGLVYYRLRGWTPSLFPAPIRGN